MKRIVDSPASLDLCLSTQALIVVARSLCEQQQLQGAALSRVCGAVHRYLHPLGWLDVTRYMLRHEKLDRYGENSLRHNYVHCNRRPCRCTGFQMSVWMSKSRLNFSCSALVQGGAQANLKGNFLNGRLMELCLDQLSREGADCFAHVASWKRVPRQINVKVWHLDQRLAFNGTLSENVFERASLHYTHIYDEQLPPPVSRTVQTMLKLARAGQSDPAALFSAAESLYGVDVTLFWNRVDRHYHSAHQSTS